MVFGFFLLQECCLWCVDSCISREKWAARSGKWMNYIKSWSSWFRSIEIRLKVKYTVVHCISSLPEKNGKHFESCTWFSVYFCFSIWLSCNLSVVFGAPRFRFKYKLLKRDEKNVIIISKLNVMTFHWFFFSGWNEHVSKIPEYTCICVLHWTTRNIKLLDCYEEKLSSFMRETMKIVNQIFIFHEGGIHYSSIFIVCSPLPIVLICFRR